jgi:hypothetical protein
MIKASISGLKPALDDGAASNCSTTADQIDHDHHQRYYQQQVNQTSGHMQAESQKPQN